MREKKKQAQHEAPLIRKSEKRVDDNRKKTQYEKMEYPTNGTQAKREREQKKYIYYDGKFYESLAFMNYDVCERNCSCSVCVYFILLR